MTIKCHSAATCNEGMLGPSLTDACSGSTSFIAFMSLLNLLIRDNKKISGKCERVKPVKRPDQVYDFVVVGGGAAGSVVAARLSEVFDWKVLLLEAGGDEPAGAQVPAFAFTFLGTQMVWNYTTTNETHSCLSTNGSCAWPSGKNLGGNTVHNTMIYLRGNPTDYNNWAELGNEGWTWKEVERYFLKAEDNGEIERVGRVHHATGGPLSVGRFPHIPPLGHSILKAARQAGYNVSEDLNGDTKTGFSIIQGTQKNGVRRSSAAAYLWPVRNRENLHVSLNSTVTKVLIENDVAIGVEYYKDGKRRRVHVTREVIVSGGSMGSPHLLLLSGIGPKKHLESVGVKVVKDLPGVGENLHDHPTPPITFTLNDPHTYDNDLVVAAEYLAFQNGPLSSIGSNQALGLLATHATSPDYPDIQIYFHGYHPNCASNGGAGVFQSARGQRTVIVGPSLLHPKSRGRITLASKDPFELPLIWANYLGEPEDLDRIVEGVKMALKLIDTEALRKYNFTLVDAPLKACSEYEFQSDEYWACVVQQENYTIYHQAGTCKMGPSTDPMAVVDHRLRVRGIKRLRVADNSIMPKVTSGNTAAPAIMIGERAADFVKQDWKSI